jgi:hypothetical protein
MGRRPWTNRLTVEDCPIRLSITQLARDGVLEFSYQGSSSYAATLSGVEIALFQFQRYDNISGYSLYFPPQVLRPSEPDVRSAGQWIYLSGSRCIGRRRRFWFTCVCRRSAGILYLPPGTAEFRCRLCCNLTYRSCQVRQKGVKELATPRRKKANRGALIAAGPGIRIRVQWRLPERLPKLEMPEFLKR